MVRVTVRVGIMVSVGIMAGIVEEGVARRPRISF